MKIEKYIQALQSNLLVFVALIVVYGGLVCGVVMIDAKPQPEPEEKIEIVEREVIETVPIDCPVDVVFIFDTTGSMSEEIHDLRNIAIEFADKLAASGADYKLSMVCFRAREDSPTITDTFAPSSDVVAFKSFVGRQNAGGGGNEDQPAAILYALDNFGYRPDSLRMMVLITDEPVLGNETYGGGYYNDNGSAVDMEWEDIIARLIDMDFTVYAVAFNYESYWRIAEDTSGSFYDIQSQRDFTDILLNIAEEITVIVEEEIVTRTEQEKSSLIR